MKVAVSACLLGFCCRYDGKSKPDTGLKTRLENHIVFPVCPEQLGGMPTPRPACHIEGGSGFDVLEGRARVMDIQGRDQTGMFIKGAKAVLDQVKANKIEKCFLKSKSPSCGSGLLQKNRQKVEITPGIRLIVGVTAALLFKKGVDIEEIR